MLIKTDTIFSKCIVSMNVICNYFIICMQQSLYRTGRLQSRFQKMGLQACKYLICHRYKHDKDSYKVQHLCLIIRMAALHCLATLFV